MPFPIMSLPVVLKTVKWGAVIILLILALTTYRQQVQARQILQDNLIQANADKVSAQARVHELESVNDELALGLRTMEANQRASSEAITDLKKKVRDAEAEAARQKARADAARLQSVANQDIQAAVEESNTVTKERFDELEALFTPR